MKRKRNEIIDLSIVLEWPFYLSTSTEISDEVTATTVSTGMLTSGVGAGDVAATTEVAGVAFDDGIWSLIGFA